MNSGWWFIEERKTSALLLLFKQEEEEERPVKRPLEAARICAAFVQAYIGVGFLLLLIIFELELRDARTQKVIHIVGNQKTTSNSQSTK